MALDVLVVDDNEGVRRGLRSVVEGLHHSCRLAEDGADALEMHEARPADVILSDWEMRTMSGEELCGHVRAADDNTRYTYFIMMTAFDDREHLLRGMAAGADDYQPKPVDIVALEGHLLSAQRVIARQGRLAEAARALVTGIDLHSPLSLAGTAMRVRMDEDVERFFANSRRYKRSCCVAAIALEHLSAVDVGSRASVLGEAANAVRFALRHGDAFFRDSEAEMLLVFPEQRLADASLAVARIRKQIAKLGLVSSAGLAQIEPFDKSAEDWIRRVRRALSNARASGEGFIIDG